VSGERLALAVLAWLATYLIHSTLLLGATWLLTRGLARRLDGVAELCWKLALLGALISASLQAAMDIDPLPRRLQLSFATSEAARGGDSRGSSTSGSAGGQPARSWPLYVTSLWALGAAAGVLRLVGTRRRWQRALASCTPLESELHRALLQRSRAQEEIPISVCDAVQVPLVHGGQVYLPVWVVTDLSLDQLACVLAHEVAHVRRGDTRWRWITAVLERVLFMQPLNRLASRRLRDLAECLCDDVAVERTGTPLVLASALAAVASRVSSSALDFRFGGAPAILGSRDGSLLIRRVERILTSSRTRFVRPTRPARWLACVASCALLTLLAPRVRSEAASDGASIAPVYTISAQDPAGKFTVMLHGARVIGATIDGRALPLNRIDQQGTALRLIEDDGTSFTIQLTAPGGIHWQPRRPRIVAERFAT
jgi:hypothetical protein